ncbi:MAG: lactate utilization protein [Synergistaceae bacterium]|nr:lactate utilization protein [Synergistaceae bacterium]
MTAFEKPAIETRDALGKKLCATLVSVGYKTARYAAAAEEAAKLALETVPDGCTVGVPGTVTIRELGLMEKFAAKGCTVYHHWDPALTPETRGARLAAENSADWFVTSSNALTFDGKMVNIDGTGNRVAGMSWGLGKILFIVSLNKVERDVDSAIKRARDRATPPNVLRIGGETPCAKLGYCVDCNSPDRICRVLTIIERVPLGREAHVILVGEPLGY